MTERQYRILILEDSRPLADVVSEAFAKRGFDPVVVATAKDGIKELENSGHVDLVWLDHYLLGSENGLDFAKRLKGRSEWKNIPIFVVSNTASDKNIQSYADLGIMHFYAKPDHNILHIINDVESLLKKGDNK